MEEKSWKEKAALAVEHLRMCASYEDNTYKKNAFTVAADNIEQIGEGLRAYYPDNLQKIKGVGKSTAKILRELFAYGISTRTEVAKIYLEKHDLIRREESGTVICRPVESVKELIDRIKSGLLAFDGVKKVEVVLDGERSVSKAEFAVEVEDTFVKKQIIEWVMEKGANGVVAKNSVSAIFEGDFRVNFKFLEEVV